MTDIKYLCTDETAFYLFHVFPNKMKHKDTHYCSNHKHYYQTISLLKCARLPQSRGKPTKSTGFHNSCLSHIILQILCPCASRNSLVSFCTVLKGVKSSFKSSLWSLVPDLLHKQAELQQLSEVASSLLLLKFAAYAWFTCPSRWCFPHLPKTCCAETRCASLTDCLGRGSSHSQKRGICTITGLLQHERAKMRGVLNSVSPLQPFQVRN